MMFLQEWLSQISNGCTDNNNRDMLRGTKDIKSWHVFLSAKIRIFMQTVYCTNSVCCANLICCFKDIIGRFMQFKTVVLSELHGKSNS